MRSGHFPQMVAVWFVLCLGLAIGEDGAKFRKIVIDTTFRSEGVATGDVNHDGRTDVLVGDVWYEAPDLKADPNAKWTMHAIRKVGEYNPAKGYSRCFANFAQDVNGDGWIDQITVGFPAAECYWYENPQNRPGDWKQRVVAKSACNETPLCADLLGDGRGVPLFGCDGRVAWFTIPKDLEQPWDMHVIGVGKGSEKFAHGLGVGDVNGDGRRDVLITSGWWEAPEDRTQGPWPFHAAPLGPNCADLVVYDVDGDGDNDVITSSAHGYGIWWFEQVKGEKGMEFKQHEIYKAFSQTHALILADINRDGLMDLVTGKRYFAHCGKDPGGHEPAVLYWFELQRKEPGKPTWVPHEIDNDSGVGTQFEVTDLNGDGLLDVVTSNKKGVHVFLQTP